MSRKEKIIQRLKNRPKDFTYDELRTLLNYIGFEEDNKGNTSGSRVEFIHKDTKTIIKLHKPHPRNIMKPYQINIVIESLKKIGVI